MPVQRTSLALSLALSLACAACGDGGGASSGTPKPAAGGDAAKPAPAAKGAGGSYDKAKGTATLKGVIRYVGTIPPQKTYNMDSEPKCCPPGTTASTIEKTEVNAGSTLPHVFVSLAEGAETSMTGFEPRVTEVDQKGCTYVPHVFGVMAGQDVKFKNSDTFNHNVHVKGQRQQDEFNKSQSAGQADVHQFDKELNVKIICDVHSWMGAYMHVVDHPFYATSARGDGTYEIKGLYPGKHKFKVWHENWAPKGKEMVFEIDLMDGENVRDVEVAGDK